MTTFAADNLRFVREYRGLTNKDLAKRVGLASASSIDDYERRGVIPPPDRLRAIADALDMPVEFFEHPKHWTQPGSALHDFHALGDKKEYAGLEAFPNPTAHSEIEFTSNELTAICPVTGQPDFYAFHLMYCPQEHCVESKSLKLYLRTFDGQGMFAEALAQRILDDLVALLAPRYASVTLTQAVRGGLELKVTTRWNRVIKAGDGQG